jgi:hypothetical protein
MSDFILQLIAKLIHLIFNVCTMTLEETGLDGMVTMFVQ